MPGAAPTIIKRTITRDRIMALADYSGHHPDDVERDLPILAQIRRDKVWAVNRFFVIGDPWFLTPLEDFQVDAIRRLDGPHALGAEVIPRGHTKTTMLRAWTALLSGCGQEQYIAMFSLTEDGWEGNLEALEQVYTADAFAPLQWLMHYVHGREIAKRQANIVRWGNGAVTEFKSLLGEARGLNRPDAGGRPSLVPLDDIIPTDAIDSPSIRRRITMRYLSMVRPMGREGARIRITGTPMHRQDLIGQIMTGVLKGFTVTPPHQRRAYDEVTGEVLFKGRWTMGDLLKIRDDEYVSTGNLRLFKREYLCDLSEDQTHPFTQYADTMPTIPQTRIGSLLPECDATLAVDNAKGGGGDNFVALLYWRDRDDNRYVVKATISNEMDLDRRLAEVYVLCRRWKPRRLVIQKNTESGDFIDVLEQYLRDRKVWTQIVRVPVSNKAKAKNSRIYSWLQPVVSAGKVYFVEGGEYISHAKMEMGSFDTTADNNVDDFLDTWALAEEYSEPPSYDAPEISTGNPSIDAMMKELLGEQARGGVPKSRQRRHPTVGKRPKGWL